MEKSANISACQRYRYQLTRRWWAAGPTLQWVMLNPSTADDKIDDPTIRRCIGFAKRNGFGGILVYNLLAYRSDDPKALRGETGVDTTNLELLRNLRGLVICGWGSGVHYAQINAHVAIATLRQSSAQLMCLGTTKDGHPKHPLYVRGDTPFQDWTK